MAATDTETTAPERVETSFTSGGERCAAWHYAPPDSECHRYVRRHGTRLQPHPPRRAAAIRGRARRRRGPRPRLRPPLSRRLRRCARQRLRRGEQLEDWRNAIAFARTLDGVVSERIVLWGFSFSGGHAITLAAERDDIAAAIVLCPLVDGLRRALGTPPSLSAWIMPRALADAAGRHKLIPVTAQPGEHAAMTLPGEADGFARAVPEVALAEQISPHVFLGRTIRPVRRPARCTCAALGRARRADISVHGPAVEQLAEERAADSIATTPTISRRLPGSGFRRGSPGPGGVPRASGARCRRSISVLYASKACRPRRDRRLRRPRAQPEGRRRRDAAQRAGRHHGAVGLGQVVARVRHDLRRGPAALRRVAVGLRAAVPRADGQARRRLDRGAVAGDLDRPEDDLAQPALDGRHRHRDLRLPAPAVGARRASALPKCGSRSRARRPSRSSTR